ncbi:hypothetical protein YC2023_090096 [Brassica napus]
MLGVMVGAPLKVRPDLLWGCRYPRSGALLWITSEAVGVVVDHIGNVNDSPPYSLYISQGGEKKIERMRDDIRC